MNKRINGRGVENNNRLQLELARSEMLEMIAVELQDPEMEVHVNAAADMIALHRENDDTALSEEPFRQLWEANFAKAA